MKKIKMKKGNVISIIYFTVLFLFVLLRICFSLGVFSGLNSVEGDVVSSLLIQVVLILGIGIGLYMLVFKRDFKETASDFNFKKMSGKNVLISFGIGLCVFVLNIFIANFFNIILSVFGYRFPTGSGSTETTFPLFLLSVFLTAILPGFCEEILHRGLLLQGMKNKIGVKNALIFSSLLFGLMHMNVGQFFYATILGFFMGYLTIATQNIWPAMIVHFTNNFMNVYLSYASSANLPFGNFYEVLNSLMMEQGFLFGLIFVFGLIYLLYKAVSILSKKLVENINGEKFISSLITINNIVNLENGMEESNFHLNKQDIDMIFKQIANDVGEKEVNNLILVVNNDLNEVRKGVKIKVSDNIFLFASVFLGAIITIFTFIWGVL